MDPDEADIVEALAASGADADIVAWDAPVDWANYNLVVIRSTWDYAERIGEFLEWIDHVSSQTKLRNDVEALRVNSNKRYLAALGDAGVPVVPTKYIDPSERLASLPWDAAEFVVKPSVSAGSRDTFRCSRAEIPHHIARIHATLRTAMVQPYLSAVDHDGESSIIFVGEEYSHAFHKGPMLANTDEHPRRLEERIRPHTPSAAEIATARQCRSALPALGINLDELLYARIDLVEQGSIVLEVELIEPALNLSYAPGALDKFIRAVILAAEG